MKCKKWIFDEERHAFPWCGWPADLLLDTTVCQSYRTSEQSIYTVALYAAGGTSDRGVVSDHDRERRYGKTERTKPFLVSSSTQKALSIDQDRQLG